MTVLFPRVALPIAVLGALLVGGCTDSALRSSASPAQMAACRSRADAIYEHQNRADIFREDAYASGQRDAPFGGASSFGSTASLSNRFARERLVDRCLAGTLDRIDTPEPLDPHPSAIPVKPLAQP